MKAYFLQEVLTDFKAYRLTGILFQQKLNVKIFLAFCGLEEVQCLCCLSRGVEKGL